ncbi:MAG: excinuclease ABC subunit UvrC [Syntrophomonadaceae bacterium]|jgi:excinuclease ABC subunit C|nr:excinuclease ABC subunit UvrC [Syntrophomonadaceae bacterium]
MKDKLKNVPLKPGVYLFKDASGGVIYVGKAKLLRRRMHSYFQADEKLLPKVKAMINKAEDFDFIVTAGEIEALLLENNFIKAYQPRYNIMLRDDKTYPHLKISVKEKFPRVSIVRGENDGKSCYFGPYADVGALRETLPLLCGIFKLRTCKNMQRQSRACLNHDIGKCMAPCSGKVNEKDYRVAVDELIIFLSGSHIEIIKGKEAAMKSAAKNLEFEKAARLRNEIECLQKIGVKQQITLQNDSCLDIVAFAQGKKNHLAVLFKIRGGGIVAKDTIWLTGLMSEELPEMAGSFIKRYYDDKEDLPREILVKELPSEENLLKKWLCHKAGHKVEMAVPKRGEKKKLLDMVQGNADLLIEEFLKDSNRNEQLLITLSKVLELEVIPSRMECYDISHLGGQDTVASMVVFQDAKSDRKAYRRFKITEDKNNDFAALAETLRRRFEEMKKGNRAFGAEPDLIVIDGGLGQLHAVVKELEKLEINIPVISLAKKEEIIYRSGGRFPLKLSRKDESLRLLQRLRDEAHRFAVTYNRKRREQKTRVSILDKIPGIGTKRKQALLKYFGSAAKVKTADVEELLQVKGITRPVAEEIVDFFHASGSKTS